MSKTWFTCRAVDGELDIAIYDEIGLFGVSAADFHRDLKAAGQVSHINLSINSPGGNVFDGLAIYNMLQRHAAHVTVRVDGVAASAASLIAMAGDVVLMPENSFMMIHDPAGAVMGRSKEMRDLADALDKVKEGLLSAYTNKSGMDRADIADMMTAETWMTAEEAVEHGFADAIEAPVQMAASFDLSKFRNAPADIAGRKRGAAASNPADPKETIMTDSIETPATEPEVQAGATDIPAEETAPEPVEAAPEPTPEPVDMTASIRAEERERASAIMTACRMVGKSDKAGEFIASDKTLAQVVAELQAERAQSPEITSRHSANTEPPKVDWSKITDKVNARVSARVA